MGKGRHVRAVLLAYSGRTAGGLAAARTNQGTRTHAGEGCAPVCVLATPAPCSLAAPACTLAGPCLAASQRPRPTGPARQRPAASQHARSRRPRPAASRRPWQIGSARPRSRHGPCPCWPWAGHRCRPALDLEFQVRRSGGEKPENGARDFFLGDKGVIWSFHGGSIWLLTEETNRLDGSAR